MAETPITAKKPKLLSGDGCCMLVLDSSNKVWLKLLSPLDGLVFEQIHSPIFVLTLLQHNRVNFLECFIAKGFKK
jgi:hypothetical protein